ncbi:hypothetical protein [Mycolicibacterium grossiae]|nr:hypothetical protein [Mycolicibacterium grossiae]
MTTRMTHTAGTPGRRRATTAAVLGGALVVGMLGAAPFALADPESPITPGGSVTPVGPQAAGGAAAADGASAAPANDARAGDQALAEIAAQYDTGAGGGQIANLIHSVMILRSQGFYPSKGNVMALQDGLDKRPNQGPLVQALEETLAFQRRNKMRGQAQPQAPTTLGVTPGGAPAGPGVNIPLG